MPLADEQLFERRFVSFAALTKGIEQILGEELSLQEHREQVRIQNGLLGRAICRFCVLLFLWHSNRLIIADITSFAYLPTCLPAYSPLVWQKTPQSGIMKLQKMIDERAPSTLWRILQYIAVSVLLILAAMFVTDTTREGSTELHAILDATATLLALMVGLIAFIRYYSKKNPTFLYIGVGFLGTALLEGYNTLITSSLWSTSLISWGWLAARIFLSGFLVLSWLAWWHAKRTPAKETEEKEEQTHNRDELKLFISAELMMLACFVLLVFAPLPPAYYPNSLFGRPMEYIPAALFFVALIGYLMKSGARAPSNTGSSWPLSSIWLHKSSTPPFRWNSLMHSSTLLPSSRL